MSSAPFALGYDPASGVLSVIGDVENESISTLRDAIAEHSSAGTTALAVDLTRATYLPSAAIGMLVRATKLFKSTGTPFEMVAAADSVADRILTLCALPHRTY